MNLENDRFTWKQGDIKFINSNGDYIENEKDYFNNRKQEMLTIRDELQVGDVVKLKSTGEIATISKINFAGFRYAGNVQGESDLTLFSQEDIQEVLSKVKSRSI